MALCMPRCPAELELPLRATSSSAKALPANVSAPSRPRPVTETRLTIPCSLFLLSSRKQLRPQAGGVWGWARLGGGLAGEKAALGARQGTAGAGIVRPGRARCGSEMTRRRALIVGAGGFGREWGKVLRAHPEVEIAGWVSRRESSVREAVAALGLGELFIGTDLDLALRRLRPDFVVDVTPPEAHHDVTLAALGAGVPVLGEKPMAASLAQARAMVAASERSGKLYMVSQSRRYHRGLRALRR